MSRYSRNKQDENGYLQDAFVASDDDDDEFETMHSSRSHREETPGGDLGPPITTDERMAALPDIHRVLISDFVEEAKKLEENIRNKTNARKPFFTEANFREMAIHWTLTLEDMRQISGINIERVNEFGKRFVSVIQQYYKSYNELMSDHEDRDIDKNHQNVINLVSDGEEDEEVEEETDYDASERDDTDIIAAETSKFFQTSNTDRGVKGSRKASWKSKPGGRSAGSQKKSRGGGHWKYKKGSRKSTGSASGRSNSGVSKRSSMGDSKKSRSSKPSNASGSGLKRAFGYKSSGNIAAMPT